MGTWSAKLDGNDTACEFIEEYKLIFSKYDVEEGIALLDGYMKQHRRDYDEDMRRDYIYTLARFLWKRGRLTEDVKARALKALASDRATIYREGGEELYHARIQELQKLKGQLLSPQCAPKSMKRKLNPNDFLAVGDIVSLKLGEKYIVVQKTEDDGGEPSAVDPTIRGEQNPNFALLAYCKEVPPTAEEALSLPVATTCRRFFTYRLEGRKPIPVPHEEFLKYSFYCMGGDAGVRRFKKMEFRVLANKPPVDAPVWIREGNTVFSVGHCIMWTESCIKEVLAAASGEHVVCREKPTNRAAIEYLTFTQGDVFLKAMHTSYRQLIMNGEIEDRGFAAYVKQFGYYNEELPD